MSTPQKGQDKASDSSKSQGSDSSGAQGSRWQKRQNNKPKSTPKGKAEAFSGHTEDLKKYVITEAAGNKATQYKEMHERMCTYASRNYSANVASSLKKLETLTILDFMPKPLDKKLYTRPVTDAAGNPILNDNGTIKMIEDMEIKETLKEMREHQLKNNTQRMTKYEDDMRSMYWIVLGQVDDNFKQLLEGQASFEEVNNNENTIELLTMIRDLCYREARSKVHRLTNLIRALRKLLTVRQKGGDSVAYANEVIERFNVLKSIGGSLICDEALSAVLELDDNKTVSDYNNMSDANKQVWDSRTEQAFLAALIIEGSNEDTSTLRQRLGLDYAMGNNLYPVTTSRAIEMMNEFKNTKQKTNQQHRGSGNSKKPDRQQPNSQVGSISVNQGHVAQNPTYDDATDHSDDDNPYYTEGAQALMAAMETDEQFNHEADIFVTFGEVNHMTATDDEDIATIASNSSTDDWNYWVTKDEADTMLDNISITSNAARTPSTTNQIDTTIPHHDSPPSTPLLLPALFVSGRSDTYIETHAGTHSADTTLTTESEDNKSDESSGQKRKAITMMGDVDRNDAKGHNKRPDPPGTTIASVEKPRSGENIEKPRSGKVHATRRQSRRSDGHQHGMRRRGWTNLAALDLAVTEWQSNTIMEPQQYRFSNKVERMFAQHRGGIDPNWILLDSESSVNLVVNESLLTNIRRAPNGSTLTVHCNAGSAVTNEVGELPGFGTVWLYRRGIANVISLGLVTNKYRVTMDSDIDNAIYVHKENGDIRRFHRGKNNLYYYDTRDGASEETPLLTITTIEGQKRLFSGADRKRAERAYKLQEIVGFPNDADFLKMVDNKILQNCPITRRDVLMARQIYGKNKASIQGKTTRRQVPHVREDIELVPNEILMNYKNVTLCCDIFHVNGVRFFTTISKHLSFRTVRAINNARRSTIGNCIKSVIGQYAARGFTVRTVFADNQFECVRDDLIQLDNPVELNTTATDEHEPFVERSIRTMKERIRCIYHTLPFRRVPVRMIAEMVYASVFWLNSFVPKNGVSEIMSPREIMVGYSLDAAKHARFQYGEYLMAHVDETNNSMDSRASGSIYLRPSGNRQGGFFAFDLQTARRVHRMHGTSLPMTEEVINRIEEICEQQSAPEGLIFGDRNNTSTIHDFEEPEIKEDDNVSDSSYVPDNDEESVATALTNITEVTEIDVGPPGEQQPEADNAEHMNNAPNDELDGEERNDEPADENEDDVAREVSETEDNNTVAEDERSIEESSEHEINNDMANTEEEVHADDVEDREVDTEAEENDGHTVTDRRMTLRPTVKRTHNKYYGSGDGYTPSVLHRGSFFTAGYAAATNKMVRDEIGYIHTATAIQQYNNLEASHVTKQYGVRQGIKIFGDDGVNAVLKELKQIHDRVVVVPMDPSKMTKEMRDKALPYLMFLKRKRCGKIKGRGCADGRRQREFISKEEASSPTVSLYALMISCLIDAIEERDVATADIPGAFLQTDMPDDEEVYIRLDGTMAELLCKLDPNLYAPCMIDRGGRKTLYARAKKAIYGTLRAALLFWEKLSGTLSEWGFEANPYDHCTMNKMIDGKQATICWHVDDLKISHKDPKVVTRILDKLNEEFGRITPLTVTRGKIHDYVGMTIDYTERGKVKFSMFDYLEEIIQGLPCEFKGSATSPAGNHLFTVNEEGQMLDTETADRFHHYVAKLLFMAKRTRPDIATAVAFLCTRVKAPDADDWKKLGRLMKYLQATPFLPLCLGWDGSGDIKWFVDASFAVHKDMKSHTGGMMTLGQGALISVSTKQKINTKSSTEAELVGVDDIMNIQVWSRYFIDSQYEHSGVDTLVKKDRLYQDNTSSIKLEENGKASSTRRTRHINIRYFFVTDRVKAGKLNIEYCPTEEMIADYFTKPLQGKLFRLHRNSIQGVSEAEFLAYKDAYNAAKRVDNPSPNSPAITNGIIAQ